MILQEAFETIALISEELRRTEFGCAFCKKKFLSIDFLYFFAKRKKKFGRGNDPSKKNRGHHREPSVRSEEIIYVNETYANVTLAFERCCVTKMRFTRVCMGTLRVCFKYVKSDVLWIKLTYLAFLSYSLLFHGVWGHFKALKQQRIRQESKISQFYSQNNTTPLEGKSHVRVRFIHINDFLWSHAWVACGVTRRPRSLNPGQRARGL